MVQMLTVEGMTCDHCKMTVEKAVRALKGVKSALVNLAKKNLTVEFDESAVNLKDITAAVENQGYTVV
ncbi:MAG: copper ion binding protein [Spirochaetota bacterium]